MSVVLLVNLQVKEQLFFHARKGAMSGGPSELFLSSLEICCGQSPVLVHLDLPYFDIREQICTVTEMTELRRNLLNAHDTIVPIKKMLMILFCYEQTSTRLFL